MTAEYKPPKEFEDIWAALKDNKDPKNANDVKILTQIIKNLGGKS